jgi:hypothetical protein
VSKLPPDKLDPHAVIRSPSGLPKLVQMGIHDMILTEQGGKGPSADDLIRSYNIICWSLLTAGPGRNGAEARLKTDPHDASRVVLTNLGEDREREKLNPSVPSNKERLAKRKRDKKAGRKRGGPKKPVVPFHMKAQALQRWAKSVYDKDPERFQLNWWDERSKRG